MRVCVFSDIHGNQYALRAFADLLPSLRIDRYIFCGDVFGYYYGQQETLAFLANLSNLVWLLGNHDRNFIDAVNGAANVESLANRYGNSYRLATAHPDRKSFVNTLHMLRPKAELFLCGKRLIAVHGTMDDPLDGRIYPKDAGVLHELIDVDVCVTGHSHFRMYVQTGGTVYINPGSLGQPRDRQKSCFAVLTLPECSVEFVDVQYDAVALDAQIRQNDPGNEKLLELLHRSDY